MTAFLEDGTPAAEKQADRVTEKGRKLFADWLSGHGEQDVVNDETGVGVATNPTRLWAFLYNTSHGDSSCSAELEFRVVLPDGREIMEFVAGYGDTEDAAIGTATLNFILSTFHVIYAATMNLEDPHMEHESIKVCGHPFLLTSGGFVTFGETDKHDYDALGESFRDCLSQLNLSDQMHWGKVVYGRAEGEMVTAAFTIDNASVPSLTTEIEGWTWPETEKFYMSKLFFVLRPAPIHQNNKEQQQLPQSDPDLR